MRVVGIDEVGRGCWAGPVVAAAVLLREPLAGLADSKVLSASKRQALDPLIRAQAVAYGIGWVSNTELDAIGLTAAVRLAMERAMARITTAYDMVIIDGNYNFLSSNPLATTLVKADATIPAVSAASVIAKAARDAFMAEQARLYPEYGFERHVGYGTRQHQAALQRYGVTPIHRFSYQPVKAVGKLHE